MPVTAAVRGGNELPEDGMDSAVIRVRSWWAAWHTHHTGLAGLLSCTWYCLVAVGKKTNKNDQAGALAAHSSSRLASRIARSGVSACHRADCCACRPAARILSRPLCLWSLLSFAMDGSVGGEGVAKKKARTSKRGTLCIAARSRDRWKKKTIY